VSDEPPRDERAERRDRRRKARRDAMRKHGATTGETYRNAVLNRFRKMPRRKA
jgi:hypothetical protein